MVVYVHSGNLFGYARYSQFVPLVPLLSKFAQCGVPIFFIISGYLAGSSGKRTYLEMIKKKVKSLLIPFVTWNLFYLLFEWIGHCILSSAFDDITKWTIEDTILNLFGIPFAKGCLYGPLWFVRELFVLFLLYPVIVLSVKRLPSVILILGFIVIIVGNMPLLYDNGYYLKSSIPFFSLGLWTSFHPKEICIRKEIVIGAALAAIILVYINRIYDNSNIVSTGLSYSAILLFFPLVFHFGKYVEKTKDLSKLLLSISKYSFMIFVLHGKLLTIFQNVCVKVITQDRCILLAEYIVLPILVIAVVMLISSFLCNKMPLIYRFLTGERS